MSRYLRADGSEPQDGDILVCRGDKTIYEPPVKVIPNYEWQIGRPTEPGWYWISGSGTWISIIHIMDDFKVWLTSSSLQHTMDDIFDEHDGIARRFAGPLIEPKL